VGRNAGIVHAYYHLVDHREFATMLSLFHPDIHNQRGDRQISGITQLREFYLRERTIRSGRHDIDVLIEDDSWVVTRGTLDGVLESGEKVSAEFADFHQFQDELIWRRFTYFRNRAV
jgi:hypothetical protein